MSRFGYEREFGYGPGYEDRTGKAQKDQFSIDGKTWAYRDPDNRDAIDRQNSGRERGFTNVNQNSSAMYDPLYDYDYGAVRDAAKQLGIGNVNDKKEVKEIMNYLQTPRASQADFDDLEGRHNTLRGDFDESQKDPKKDSGETIERAASFNEAMGASFGKEKATDLARGMVGEQVTKATGGFSDATGAETAEGDTSEAEAAAQDLLASKLAEVASDKDTMERGKFNQGKYVLSNLGGSSYSAS